MSSAKTQVRNLLDLRPKVSIHRGYVRECTIDRSFADLPVENGIFNGTDNAPGAIMLVLMNEVYFCRGPWECSRLSR